MQTLAHTLWLTSGRLRALLEEEEQMYAEEITLNVETPLEREVSCVAAVVLFAPGTSCVFSLSFSLTFFLSLSLRLSHSCAGQDAGSAAAAQRVARGGAGGAGGGEA
jgi:hypothetical protein